MSSNLNPGFNTAEVGAQQNVLDLLSLMQRFQQQQINVTSPASTFQQLGVLGQLHQHQHQQQQQQQQQLIPYHGIAAPTHWDTDENVDTSNGGVHHYTPHIHAPPHAQNQQTLQHQAPVQQQVAATAAMLRQLQQQWSEQQPQPHTQPQAQPQGQSLQSQPQQTEVSFQTVPVPVPLPGQPVMPRPAGLTLPAPLHGATGNGAGPAIPFVNPALLAHLHAMQNPPEPTTDMYTHEPQNELTAPYQMPQVLAMPTPTMAPQHQQQFDPPQGVNQGYAIQSQQPGPPTPLSELVLQRIYQGMARQQTQQAHQHQQPSQLAGLMQMLSLNTNGPRQQQAQTQTPNPTTAAQILSAAGLMQPQPPVTEWQQLLSSGVGSPISTASNSSNNNSSNNSAEHIANNRGNNEMLPETEELSFKPLLSFDNDPNGTNDEPSDGRSLFSDYLESSNPAARELSGFSRVWCFWADLWTIQEGKPCPSTMWVFDESDTADSFWRAAGRLSIGDMPMNSTIHLFVKGIRPVYEHPANCRGGHFKIRASDAKAAAQLWVRLVLGLVQEQLPGSQSVLGCSLMKKPGAGIVQLWAVNSHDTRVVEVLRTYLTSALGGDEYRSIKFCPHKYILNTLHQKKKTPPTSRPAMPATKTPQPSIPGVGPTTVSIGAPGINIPMAMIPGVGAISMGMGGQGPTLNTLPTLAPNVRLPFAQNPGAVAMANAQHQHQQQQQHQHQHQHQHQQQGFMGVSVGVPQHFQQPGLAHHYH